MKFVLTQLFNLIKSLFTSEGYDTKEAKGLLKHVSIRLNEEEKRFCDRKWNIQGDQINEIK